MIQELAVDWYTLLQQIMERGVTLKSVEQRLGGYQISNHMLRHYRAGAQPLHWRGEAMISLWCEVTGKARAGLPTTTLIRNHRVDHNRARRMEVNLPQWPPAPQPSVKPGKRRRTKEAAEFAA